MTVGEPRRLTNIVAGHRRLNIDLTSVISAVFIWEESIVPLQHDTERVDTASSY